MRGTDVVAFVGQMLNQHYRTYLQSQQSICPRTMFVTKARMLAELFFAFAMYWDGLRALRIDISS